MEHVTAKQAADMTGQSERTIRRWIQSGKLRARKVAPNRYEIAVSDLPPRKRSPLADLRAEVEGLRARIERLEGANASVRVSERQESLSAIPDASSIRPISHKPPESHYSASFVAGAFPNRADAARWLVPHGLNSALTAKTWPGWRELVPLTQENVLRFAIERCDTSNWRVTWRLHRCTDPACVCWSILDA